MPPPPTLAATPRPHVVTAGTVLFRVHQSRYAAHAFNPGPSHRYYGGGRFDGTDDDRYQFLYAGDTVDAAVSETLLRDLPLNDVGQRQLPLAKAKGRRISAVGVQHDLTLVSLIRGADLGAVAQDPWLTTCEPRDYAQTRHWAHWIRGMAPHAEGFVWRSRREPDALAYVFFEDRLPGGAFVSVDHPAVPRHSAADFDTPAGRRALRIRLNNYGVSLSRR